jgi:AraC family transcriptional regulator
MPDMASAIAPNRLRELVDTIIATLDDGAGGSTLARRAYLSRFHFDRLVRSGLGEPPAAFRRRLLLERAAWRLRRGASVTEIAFDAGYSSGEAFARASARSAPDMSSSHSTAPNRRSAACSTG